MGSEDAEVCGFMDAKLAGQRAKKRSLGAPWKVWRRHWCSVRKLGPGLGLEVLLDHGVGSCSQQQAPGDKAAGRIRVPADAILCRTESRTKQFAFGIFPPRQRKPLLYLAASSESDSQRWMASIRQMLRPRRHRPVDGAAGVHAVSMVDNAHSRSAGLTGLHGDLVASRSGVFVKDAHTGEIVEALDWAEMSGFHLATFGRADDVKRICVIHTTRRFRGGVGELHVFCRDAARLLQDLVTQGRGPRQQRRLAQRPLSLSEGDLRLAAQQQPSSAGPAAASRALGHRIAVNLVSAGLGLLLSSKSGSEVKLAHDVVDGTLDKMSSNGSATHVRRAVDNVYQPEPASASNVASSLEELEEPASRRVSNISVSSGIYEEIQDDFVPIARRRVPSNLYENPESLILNSSIKFQPPPLPPRQRHASGSTRVESASDEGFDSEGGTRSATPNTISDATPTPEDKMSESNCILVDTSEYVPMSPRPKDIALLEFQKQTQQENMYMVMR